MGHKREYLFKNGTNSCQRGNHMEKMKSKSETATHNLFNTRTATNQKKKKEKTNVEPFNSAEHLFFSCVVYHTIMLGAHFSHVASLYKLTIFVRCECVT